MITESIKNLLGKKGICKADFDPGDFFNPDFQTTVKGKNSYTTWFLFCLNDYFYEEDTYKDLYGEGTLTRYLGMLGAEIDENVIPYIDCLLNIIDPQTADSKFLIHITETLGSPPDVTFDEQSFRNLLSYIVSIYKVKGTKKSYELFFAILGYDIKLYELPSKDKINKYDNLGQYDGDIIYDNDSCQSCSQYDITIYPRDINKELTKDILERINRAIEFIEPINAKLRYIKLGYSFEDTMNINITENIDTTTETITIYDLDKKYDNGEIYDDRLKEFKPTLILPCTMETENDKGVIKVILKFSKIHQLENLKKTINVTLLGKNNKGELITINSTTNYVVGDINYDTYNSNFSKPLHREYVKYYIQIDIVLKNNTLTKWQSLYTNGHTQYIENIELYFS